MFVTGDYHAFIAGNVQTKAGQTVAAEFVGGSVSSSTEPEINSIIKRAGYGTPDNPQMPAAELARRKSVNPYYKELDFLRTATRSARPAARRSRRRSRSSRRSAASRLR